MVHRHSKGLSSAGCFPPLPQCAWGVVRKSLAENVVFLENPNVVGQFLTFISIFLNVLSGNLAVIWRLSFGIGEKVMHLGSRNKPW